MISNCGHDEHGTYSGGQAGDQGGEWTIRSWYSRPWNVILRYPDPAVANLIAEYAESAAKNDHIGYDQGDRYSFWKKLKKSGYDPAAITEDCEADCSSGIAAIIKSVGFSLGLERLQKVSEYAYTGDLRYRCEKAGFQALTEQKYLGSDDYLLRGDILLYEFHHVATNLTDGAKIKGDDVELTVLRRGSVLKGTPEIYTFQRLTKSLGLYAGEIDGSYGPKSEDACRRFQTKHGLDPDGVCGPKTWRELLTNTTR